MPIGFIKGNSYHQNWDYDRYAELPVFKAICEFARKQNLSLHFTYSHITRAYDCEIRQICYFKHSGSPYWLGMGNRGGPTPLEALCNALRVIVESNPLLEVLCLEAEVVLLGMSVERMRGIEAKIDPVADDLRKVLDSIMIGFKQGDAVVADPVPLGSLRSKPMPQGVMARLVALEENEEYIAACAQRAREAVTGIPAAPGEDDDL